MTKPTRSQQKMTRQDWVNAARQALITGGVEQVKVDRLAKRLKITRGSFYWFFKSREELLSALIQDWEQTNTQPMLDAIAALPTHSGAAQAMQALVSFWIHELDYSPAYDAAMRDWARVSPEAEAAVRRIDNKRIAALKEMFLKLDYPDDEAFIRARVTYFHQVGYYALHIKESRERRLELSPLYSKVLAGSQ